MTDLQIIEGIEKRLSAPWFWCKGAYSKRNRKCLGNAGLSALGASYFTEAGQEDCQRIADVLGFANFNEVMNWNDRWWRRYKHVRKLLATRREAAIYRASYEDQPKVIQYDSHNYGLAGD